MSLRTVPGTSGDTNTIVQTSTTVVDHSTARAEAKKRVVLGNTGGPVRTLAFSPDGSLLAAASDQPGERALLFWELATGREVLPYGGLGGDAVPTAAFSPDGHWLASVTSANEVRLWHVQEVSHKATMQHGDGRPEATPAHSVAFAPRGDRLATASPGEVCVWDLEVSCRTHEGRFGSPYTVTRIAPRLRCRLSRGLGNCTGIAFTPDGSRLLTTTARGQVHVWHVATGKKLGTPVDECDRVGFCCLTSSGDGERVAYGSDRGAWVRDAGTLRCLARLGKEETMPSVALSADGSSVAALVRSEESGRSALVVRCLAAEPGHAPVALPAEGTAALALSAAGDCLGAGSDEGLVTLWHLAPAPA